MSRDPQHLNPAYARAQYLATSQPVPKDDNLRAAGKRFSDAIADWAASATVTPKPSPAKYAAALRARDA